MKHAKPTFARLSLRTAVVAAALAAAASAQALDTPQVLEIVQRNGFHASYDVKKTHGVWSARGTNAQGEQRYLLVDDASGQLSAVARTDLGVSLPGAQQVVERLRSLGWGVIKDVEFDDGFWEAEVRRTRGGEKVEVLLHPVTLQVLSQTGSVSGAMGADGGHAGQTGGAAAGASRLSSAQVVQLLGSAGYRHIHDVEFDDGFWEADATNSRGQRVELRIDPHTGVVLRERLD